MQRRPHVALPPALLPGAVVLLAGFLAGCQGSGGNQGTATQATVPAAAPQGGGQPPGDDPSSTRSQPQNVQTARRAGWQSTRQTPSYSQQQGQYYQQQQGQYAPQQQTGYAPQQAPGSAPPSQPQQAPSAYFDALSGSITRSQAIVGRIGPGVPVRTAETIAALQSAARDLDQEYSQVQSLQAPPGQSEFNQRVAVTIHRGAVILDSMAGASDPSVMARDADEMDSVKNDLNARLGDTQRLRAAYGR